MAPQPPSGEPVPVDGSLPDEVLQTLGVRPFGVYVHVPFCAARCGYCDFNTYTAGEVSADSPSSYVQAALAEVRLAARVLAGRAQPARTVYFGGGTPTLLPAADLTGLLRAVAEELGVAAGAEVTVEANPESVTPESLAELRAGGFNRISLGMQSARPHVLAVLDRRHKPGRTRDVVRWAREAGFSSVSVDLIYGTPGETVADWRASLAEAVSMEVDHVSAYALVVERGTALHRKVSRGLVAAPDDDDLADKYEGADAVLTAAGFEWYEVSNWACGGAVSRHNLGYWRNDDWWGIGPGAHSHVGGVRWWNVRRPERYAAALQVEASPAEAGERPDAAARRLEETMLAVRLREGLDLSRLGPSAQAAAGSAAADGLLDADALGSGRGVLTLRGRLLADAVVRLLDV